MADARKNFSRPGDGMFIVQFMGPIQDEWLKELNNTGVEVISYVPNNAYIVRAGSNAAMELIARCGKRVRNRQPTARTNADLSM